LTAVTDTRSPGQWSERFPLGSLVALGMPLVSSRTRTSNAESSGWHFVLVTIVVVVLGLLTVVLSIICCGVYGAEDAWSKDRWRQKLGGARVARGSVRASRKNHTPLVDPTPPSHKSTITMEESISPRFSPTPFQDLTRLSFDMSYSGAEGSSGSSVPVDLPPPIYPKLVLLTRDFWVSTAVISGLCVGEFDIAEIGGDPVLRGVVVQNSEGRSRSLELFAADSARGVVNPHVTLTVVTVRGSVGIEIRCSDRSLYGDARLQGHGYVVFRADQIIMRIALDSERNLDSVTTASGAPLLDMEKGTMYSLLRVAAGADAALVLSCALAVCTLVQDL